MKLNEQDSLFEKYQGNQRYLIRSSEKLKQIHKQKLSHSKQLGNNLTNKRSFIQQQKQQNSSKWNSSSEYSNQSSVIILTPSRRHNKNLKSKTLPFLTQENDQSSSLNEKNNNPKLIQRNLQVKGSKVNQQKQNCSIHSYQILSDEEKSCQEQIYASMVLVTEKKKQLDNSNDYHQKNQYNYIDLLSSENKIIPHESSPDDDQESSVQEFYLSNNNSHLNSKKEPQLNQNNQKFPSQIYNRMPLQPLESNIIQNIQTPKQLRNNDHHQNSEQVLCMGHTPYSSIKKRLFDTQHDFIGSQQENIDFMIREIQSASTKDNNINKKLTFKSSSNNSIAHQNKTFEEGNRQHIVEVLEVVKIKNSSTKLAKVSVFIENAAQLQIKYVHTLEIRQTHPELLIQYYEDTFDPYFLEIKELF